MCARVCDRCEVSLLLIMKVVCMVTRPLGFTGAVLVLRWSRIEGEIKRGREKEGVDGGINALLCTVTPLAGSSV